MWKASSEKDGYSKIKSYLKTSNFQMGSSCKVCVLNWTVSLERQLDRGWAAPLFFQHVTQTLGLNTLYVTGWQGSSERCSQQKHRGHPWKKKEGRHGALPAEPPPMVIQTVSNIFPAKHTSSHMLINSHMLTGHLCLGSAGICISGIHSATLPGLFDSCNSCYS